jgi:CRISPR/Cas system-associated exonuclease Cas4 (RecB family)
MIEKMALRELEDAGFTLIDQQRAFEWKALELTGHIDAKVLWEGHAYPLEIKGLQHYDFIKLNTVEDFHKSKKPWIRKYPGQMMMYLLQAGEERGVWYIKDKMTYQPKQIWVDLDYEYAETICQKLERVNKHVKDGTLPPPINDPEFCDNCNDFLHICLPEIKRQPMVFLDDDDMLQKLNRMAELEAAVQEHKALDHDVREMLKKAKMERICIGDFVITGGLVTREGYTVKPGTYWRSNIARLGVKS